MNIIQGKDQTDKKINPRSTQLGREKKLNLTSILSFQGSQKLS
jgi:hypothetical protein